MTKLWFAPRINSQTMAPVLETVVSRNIFFQSNYLYTASWYVWGEWFLTVNHHNHKNWVPSILIHNLWLIFMGMKQKNLFCFLKKKIQNGRHKKMSIFKIANSQYFFVKIYWIGPWVSRIEWCEGHWFGSTYMAVRLSDISSKMA